MQIQFASTSFQKWNTQEAVCTKKETQTPYNIATWIQIAPKLPNVIDLH